MAKIFTPTYIYASIDKIPFEILEKNNIKGIMFDLDNTLTDYKGIMNNEKIEWIKEAKKRGIKICILSNSHRQKKIRGLMRELDINGLNLAMKPMLKGYRYALDLLDVNKENACMIGDQIFTDIWGANRFGIMSILVRPFDNNEEFWVKLKSIKYTTLYIISILNPLFNVCRYSLNVIFSDTQSGIFLQRCPENCPRTIAKMLTIKYGI